MKFPKLKDLKLNTFKIQMGNGFKDSQTRWKTRVLDYLDYDLTVHRGAIVLGHFKKTKRKQSNQQQNIK